MFRKFCWLFPLSSVVIIFVELFVLGLLQGMKKNPLEGFEL